MKLKDKNTIVTGASSGIGKGIALRFGREGANVCVVGCSHYDAAVEVAEEIRKMGRKAFAVRADVSKIPDIEMVVKQTMEHLGGIEILVNNAGIFYLRSFEETTEEEYDRTMNVNARSAFFFSQKVLPELLKRGKGKIINIGSIFGIVGAPNAAAYCTSKLGVHGLTRQLAIELAPKNITVNCIAPGSIQTPINDPLYKCYGKDTIRQQYPIARFGKVEEIAAAAVYLASDEADWVTGVVLPVDGGYITR